MQDRSTNLGWDLLLDFPPTLAGAYRTWLDIRWRLMTSASTPLQWWPENINCVGIWNILLLNFIGSSFNGSRNLQGIQYFINLLDWKPKDSLGFNTEMPAQIFSCSYSVDPTNKSKSYFQEWSKNFTCLFSYETGMVLIQYLRRIQFLGKPCTTYRSTLPHLTLIVPNKTPLIMRAIKEIFKPVWGEQWRASPHHPRWSQNHYYWSWTVHQSHFSLVNLISPHLSDELTSRTPVLQNSETPKLHYPFWKWFEICKRSSWCRPGWLLQLAAPPWPCTSSPCSLTYCTDPRPHLPLNLSPTGKLPSS